MNQQIKHWRRWFAAAFLLCASPGLWAQETALEFTDATLRDWVQPQYPPEARKAKQGGEVLVEFVVEPDGRVSQTSVKQSSNEQFEAAALKAVAQWVFSPALEEGRPIASAMVVTVRFAAEQLKQKQAPLFPRPELMPQALKLTPAKVIVAPDPDYPAELEERKIAGEVQIEFTVDTSGQVRDPRVLWASHPAFVESSLRAMEKTKFEPARQGPLPKPSTKRYPVSFQSIAARREEVFAANNLTIMDDSAPAVLPQPFVLIDPVYPVERLLAGDRGAAVVEFTVSERGGISGVRLVSASRPEFGGALEAAAESWLFQPAVDKDGTRVPVKLRRVYEFVPPAGGADARLAMDLRPGGPGVSSPAGLDQRMKPLWRGFPAYPRALAGERVSGQADIEFIIDRDGRARLPQIKSATREEFGWAAATAISQWVFERPRRKGEPVDVRVLIPVEFTPPAQ